MAACRILVVLTAVLAVLIGGIGYVVTPTVGLGRDSALFKRFPITEEFKLSNGGAVNMPFHVYEGQHLMLVGEVDHKVASSFLASIDMHPLVTGTGKALGVIGAVRYDDCVAGAYDEFYISFMATKSPPIDNPLVQYAAFALATNEYLAPLAPWLGMDQMSMVVWRMLVTTERTLLAGREIWGYPKDLADLTIIKASGPEKFGSIIDAQVHAEDGSTVAGLTFVEPEPYSLPWLLTVPMSLLGTTGTPKRFKSTFGHSYGDFLARVVPYDEDKGHSWTLGQESDHLLQGASSLSFVPWLWYDMPIFEACLMGPQRDS